MNNAISSSSAIPLIWLCLIVDVLLPIFDGGTQSAAQYTVPALVLTLGIQLLLVNIIAIYRAEQANTVKHNYFTVAMILLWSAGDLFVRMERFLVITGAESMPIWIVLVLVLVLLLLTTRSGYAAIARAGGIAIGAVIVSLTILLLANIGHASLVRLSYNTVNINKIGKAFVDIFNFPIDILLYFIIDADKIKTQKNSLSKLLISITAISILLCIMRELVLGFDGGTAIMQPMHTLARLGGLSVFKRIEAIHVFIWVFAALIKLSALFAVAAKLIKSKTNNPKTAVTLSCIVLILFIVAAYALTPFWQKAIMQLFGIAVMALSLNRMKGSIANEKAM